MKGKDSPTRMASRFWSCGTSPHCRNCSHRARMPLVAYNINLNTPSLEIAHDIAKKIRFIGGGLRYCGDHGRRTEGQRYHPGIMNLTDYSKTAIYRAFEMVRLKPNAGQVSIIGSKIVGLNPGSRGSVYQGVPQEPGHILSCPSSRAPEASICHFGEMLMNS